MADAKAIPVGTGLADLAKVDLQTRNSYIQHVSDANENGDTPLPFPEWVKQQQATQAAAKTDQNAGYTDANK